MEEVLDVYERPLDPDNPVICFDERPCQLIGDVVQPLPPKPGQERREDYHYERHGTAVVLLAVEPLTGKRIVEVRAQKRKKDYAEFMQKVADHYPKARKITLVQDNLNTHNPSSFYETFPAEEAFALSKRFEMIYTPKRASWLNMAEIDFSALAKQCLDRRIKAIDRLEKEVLIWTEDRIRQNIKIEWQFTKTKAREKFQRSYTELSKKLP